jgi:hypothetical protein
VPFTVETPTLSTSEQIRIPMEGKRQHSFKSGTLPMDIAVSLNRLDFILWSHAHGIRLTQRAGAFLFQNNIITSHLPMQNKEGGEEAIDEEGDEESD